MAITQIIPRDPPPTPAQRPVGPTTPLDVAILAVMAHGGPMELWRIRKALKDDQGILTTTHKAHARVQSLVGKGLVRWDRIPGGPARGPGASMYQLVT